jgi:hypothetical protein
MKEGQTDQYKKFMKKNRRSTLLTLRHRGVGPLPCNLAVLARHNRTRDQADSMNKVKEVNKTAVIQSLQEREDDT